MPFQKDHLDEFPWQIGWLWPHLHNYGDYKTRDTQMNKMHEQKGWIYDVPTYAWSSWNMIPLDTELKAFTMSNWRIT